MFIKRLDQEYALLLSLGGVQEDYILNELLLGAADPEYKPLIILGIDSKESYNTVRDKLLRAMPHPAATKKDKKDEARVNNLIGPSNSKSGGKNGSKTKNSIKNLNSKFQHPYGEDREKCSRCLNFGHNAKECKSNVTKKCSFCNKFGHVVSECRTAKRESSGNNNRNTVTNSTPPPQFFYCTHFIWSKVHGGCFEVSHVHGSVTSKQQLKFTQPDTKISIRTVTFPANVQSRANANG